MTSTRARRLAVSATSLTLVAGIFAVVSITGRDDSAPEPDLRAVAAPLRDGADCTELRDWYVEKSVPLLGPYGWSDEAQPMPATMEGDAVQDSSGRARSQGAEPGSSSQASSGKSNSPTGTNTQEDGVDEPDVAKTDGEVVVRVVTDEAIGDVGSRVRITDVRGTAAVELGEWRAPARVWDAELLLVGDRVVVLTEAPVSSDKTGRRFLPMPGSSGARVFVLDISDPRSPRLLSDTTYPGRRVSAYQHGDTVRLISALSKPAVQPQPWASDQPMEREDERAASKELADQLRKTEIEDWLPPSVDNLTGEEQPAVECGDVYRPRKFQGANTMVVTTLDLVGGGASRSLGVVGGAQLAYSSPDRLYIAASAWGSTSGILSRIAPAKVVTQVHAFALDGSETDYRGSGKVDAMVRDRWSFDEVDGDLRLAVAWPGSDGSTKDNGVVVLRERGDELAEVGRLPGLGTDEEIQSVRWFDDIAIMVTFRRIDPLYTIDLSDPTRPRAVGELKIPGFSSYLHPIGDDQLLGIGSDATDQGQVIGGQAAVFDISGLRTARRLDVDTAPEGSWYAASGDPRSLTWLPERRTAITVLADPAGPEGAAATGNGSQVVALEVDEDGQLTRTTLHGPAGWSIRALPLADGRVALVGDNVVFARW